MQNQIHFLQSGSIVLQQEKNRGALFQGSLQFARNEKELELYKIKAVLTVGFLHMELPKDITHVLLKVNDLESDNIAKHFEISNNFIEENLNKKINVLVHCAAGISRSSAIVIAYLMQKNRWCFKYSLEYLKDKRPIATPNKGFTKQLIQYQQFLGIQDEPQLEQNNIISDPNNYYNNNLNQKQQEEELQLQKQVQQDQDSETNKNQDVI